MVHNDSRVADDHERSRSLYLPPNPILSSDPLPFITFYKYIMLIMFIFSASQLIMIKKLSLQIKT